MTQDTSNTPRFHTFDAEPPEVKVHVGRQKRSGFWELTFECPHCGLVHRHGGGTGPEPSLGHRESHCSYGPPAFKNGYVLVEGSRGRPIASDDQRVQMYPFLLGPHIDLDDKVYITALDRVRRKLLDHPDHPGCSLAPYSPKGEVQFMGRRHDLRVLLLAAQGVDTPAGYQAVPSCGLSTCVNPRHQRLVPNAKAKEATTPASGRRIEAR